MKNGIAFIFDDDTIMFVKSYSFKKGYKIINHTINPIYIKVNLTDNIDDVCKWNQDYLVDIAYDNIKGVIKLNTSIKSIIRINSNVFKRYMKIKKIQKNVN
jgi:hypothetical protein